MDPTTEVHLAAMDESSESEERLSPGARSVDDEVDSDKSGGNSKKRKRGSYRCSRCGMPKRGHNCPDSFEGVHFAIVDTPNGAGANASSATGGTTATSQGGFGAPNSSSDESNRETLLVQVSTLREENVRLSQEVFRLREMCQFQAHALHSMQPVAGADFARSIGNAANVGGGNFQGPPQALQLFAQGFSNAAGAPLPVMGPARPGFVAPSPPMTSSPQQAITSTMVPKITDDRAPIAKRPKLEEHGPIAAPYMAQHSFPHHMPMYTSIHAPFPPEHMPELHQLSSHSRHPVAVDFPGTHDFDYERHDFPASPRSWFDNDSSTSEYYPTPEVSPPLIY